MKLLRVGMMIGRTVNIGNYESLRMDASAEVAITSDEPMTDALNALQNRLSEELDKRVAKQVEALRG